MFNLWDLYNWQDPGLGILEILTQYLKIHQPNLIRIEGVLIHEELYRQKISCSRPLKGKSAIVLNDERRLRFARQSGKKMT
jgi:hypothetical protein